MTLTSLPPRRPRKSMTLFGNRAATAAGLALSLGLAMAPAAWAASLTLTFQGLKTQDGALMVMLAGGPEGWAGKAPPAGQIAAPVKGPTVTVTFNDLKPGAYGVRAFHDVNGDGKLNTNPFGMPVEPYAFSNNAKAMAGPAPWSAASFTVTDGDNRQTIDID